eukprot:537742-Rhodomonas_salina.1
MQCPVLTGGDADRSATVGRSRSCTQMSNRTALSICIGECPVRCPQGSNAMALPNDYSRGLTWRVALPGRQNRAREEGGVFCRHPFPSCQAGHSSSTSHFRVTSRVSFYCATQVLCNGECSHHPACATGFFDAMEKLKDLEADVHERAMPCAAVTQCALPVAGHLTRLSTQDDVIKQVDVQRGDCHVDWHVLGLRARHV